VNCEQASNLVTQTFTQGFDNGRFRDFVINVLKHVDKATALEGINPGELGAIGEPGPDLAVLLKTYAEELAAQVLAPC
jgi:hypothetical protein